LLTSAQSTSVTAPTNPTSIRPRRRYLVPPAVAENHQGVSNFRFSTNDFDCAGRGALTSEGPHRIDHAHGYGRNFYRSEHRHSNCPRSRCLSVALATSTCCAKPTQTRTATAPARGANVGAATIAHCAEHARLRSLKVRKTADIQLRCDDNNFRPASHVGQRHGIIMKHQVGIVPDIAYQLLNRTLSKSSYSLDLKVRHIARGSRC
jgi:hypothetical protein